VEHPLLPFSPAPPQWKLLMSMAGMLHTHASSHTSCGVMSQPSKHHVYIEFWFRALVCVRPGCRFTLVPYAVTPNFQRWASSLAELGVSVFGESLEWVTRFGHKVRSAGEGSEGDSLTHEAVWSDPELNEDLSSA
jgi:hypothetical protein